MRLTNRPGLQRHSRQCLPSSLLRAPPTCPHFRPVRLRVLVWLGYVASVATHGSPLEHREMSEVTHGCTLSDTRVSDYPWLDRASSSDMAVLSHPTKRSAEGGTPSLACTSPVKERHTGNTGRIMRTRHYSTGFSTWPLRRRYRCTSR